MKKILIITYYWPPAGGPGVQRWLKFTNYLPEFNIQPVVYKPKNPHYPLKDQSLSVHSEVQILERSIFEPYAIAGILSKKDTQNISSGIIKSKANQNLVQKSLLYIRGNYFIPDARKFWIQPSIKFLTEYLRNQDIETIITTGPPHSMHLIGLGLKTEFPELKWIADFRDPWTNIGYHKDLKLNESSKLKHSNLESKVLKSADEIIVTSFQTKSEFESKTDKNITVITNGFDDKDFSEDIELSENFTISHIGSLLSERNPELLWEVFAELISENLAFKDFFELKLVGKVSDVVLDSIYKAGLKQYVSVEGYLDHDESVQRQRSAQVLLLIEIDKTETQGIIPGKIFEYLAAKRPILAIGPENWDVDRIIAETKSGQCFSYKDKLDLKVYILNCFNKFLKGKLKVDSENITKYSRKNLTKSLINLIK
ncbi:glycosyltransferase family protein [Psychroflexus aestuariivivens]|uniref:glycosyl transferase family 1 n=1 Tax=Psychroflexus aestuariivivens TaxID=1795040 RepID=UPI000FD9DEEC|nr:glycosyl transferase family 1 [Psychroflexus aestuariivivens]